MKIKLCFVKTYQCIILRINKESFSENACTKIRQIEPICFHLFYNLFCIFYRYPKPETSFWLRTWYFRAKIWYQLMHNKNIFIHISKLAKLIFITCIFEQKLWKWRMVFLNLWKKNTNKLSLALNNSYTIKL